jgi:hypothetical protein
MRKLSILVAVGILIIAICVIILVTKRTQPTGDYTIHAFDVYHPQNFRLSQNGLNNLPQFLSKVGLSELASLREFGGTEDLSKDLCKRLYAKYNARYPSAMLSDESCERNLKEDNNTYEEYGIPLEVLIKELDNKYLLLLIKEEGLGAPILWFMVYNIETSNIAEINFKQINNGYAPPVIVYWQDKLYFWPMQIEPFAKNPTAIYDLKTNYLEVKI